MVVASPARIAVLGDFRFRCSYVVQIGWKSTRVIAGDPIVPQEQYLNSSSPLIAGDPESVSVRLSQCFSLRIIFTHNALDLPRLIQIPTSLAELPGTVFA
jgi:hypothetical protein